MIIDIDSYLADVAENRRRAQSAARAGEVIASDRGDLPSALNLILQNGGLIQPQLARSPFAPAAARVGVPSRERAQIEHWWRTYGDEANWLLDPCASGIVALEFSAYIAPYKLFSRKGEYQTFERTLRFKAATKGFALFSIPPGRSLSRGWYNGVHWRTPVLIPPSRVQFGHGEQEFELTYVDPSAPLLPAFETLLGPPVKPY
jgi:hypothetical protein